ncbi:hypothetical protein GGTG_11596 [Gaeumannomyces tritici R3-111a-1]|uniref:Uncharacterized protein n=1 Tax=Gaeumannomyces tritici (strain R3-111a-1) TaxID=644352 RepID=J3PDM3_GAET3|nr:hypothetical protein GGTG_11596 [Gaeumannomyces tritici R3-111a-1]EJT70573.1 hypothetical protein GGTG_11596 [Gaeumannomyces tritici R3-111a-1]
MTLAAASLPHAAEARQSTGRRRKERAQGTSDSANQEPLNCIPGPARRLAVNQTGEEPALGFGTRKKAHSLAVQLSHLEGGNAVCFHPNPSLVTICAFQCHWWEGYPGFYWKVDEAGEHEHDFECFV